MVKGERREGERREKGGREGEEKGENMYKSD